MQLSITHHQSKCLKLILFASFHGSKTENDYKKKTCSLRRQDTVSSHSSTLEERTWWNTTDRGMSIQNFQMWHFTIIKKELSRRQHRVWTSVGSVTRFICPSSETADIQCWKFLHLIILSALASNLVINKTHMNNIIVMKYSRKSRICVVFECKKKRKKKEKKDAVSGKHLVGSRLKETWAWLFIKKKTKKHGHTT